jgi:hypothetical protein
MYTTLKNIQTQNIVIGNTVRFYYTAHSYVPFIQEVLLFLFLEGALGKKVV